MNPLVMDAMSEHAHEKRLNEHGQEVQFGRVQSVMAAQPNALSQPAADPCAACTTSRRDFLREAAGATIALSALFGMAPASLSALAVVEGRGAPAENGTVRYPIPDADGVVIDRANEVIIARQQRHVYAFALSCPHQRNMLKWLPDQGRFQCPKHKSKYQPDGAFISGRATRGMDRHPIRIQGKELLVDTSMKYRDDENPAQWKAARVAL